jgi:hypothetical protein
MVIGSEAFLLVKYLISRGDDVGGGDHQSYVARSDALEIDIARQGRADWRQLVQVGP